MCALVSGVQTCALPLSRVLVALLFALEGRLGLFRRLVNVAGGQIERLARLVEAAPREATAHHRGLRSPAPGRAVAVLWHLAHLPSRRTFFRPAALAPRLSHALLASASTEERRVGNVRVGTCRYRCSP